MTNKEMFMFRLGKEDRNKLDKLAKSFDRSKAWILRKAIAYLYAHRELAEKERQDELGSLS